MCICFGDGSEVSAGKGQRQKLLEKHNECEQRIEDFAVCLERIICHIRQSTVYICDLQHTKKHEANVLTTRAADMHEMEKSLEGR